MPTNKPRYSQIEIEVIILKASLDLINQMVNRETMSFSFDPCDPCDLYSPYQIETAKEAEIRFQSYTRRAYFSILLVDFLSSPPKNFFGGSGNYLRRLNEISKSPLLRSAGVEALSKAVRSFQCWLGETIEVESWFASLDLEIDLSIERQTFVTMCGNIGKHNFTRQTRQAEKLQQVLSQNGHDVSLDRCLIALGEDFPTIFSDNIFIYHSSTMAEFLNDIRWGIYYYARMEREQCVVEWYDADLKMEMYKYNYPEGIVSELGKGCYWGLMNDVRRPPYIRRFEVTKSLKTYY